MGTVDIITVQKVEVAMDPLVTKDGPITTVVGTDTMHNKLVRELHLSTI